VKILFFFILMGCAWFLFAYVKAKQKQENAPQDSTKIGTEVDIARANEAEMKIIRQEIRSAIEKHATAVSILQALSRVDGRTSEAERNLVFEFLNRNGAGLSPERHRPFFSDSTSGEWNYAVEIDKFKKLITPLAPMPLPYRIDLFATASAIVAVGGTPKKREAEAMELLRELINEKGK